MIRRRVLARQLRAMREEAGLTLEQAAPKLDFSVSKLSRIENAQVIIDVHWVKSMLDVYDVGGDRWTELVELAREARQPGWWRAYGLGKHTWYIGYETEARRVQEFMVAYVPGLMQTADYARALMRAVPVRRTADELENEVAARMYRQHRLSSAEDPLELVAVVDEAALRRPVGGPAVLRAQLGRIIELAALETVTLHVLPATVGAHAALPSGFTILNFGDLGEPDMVYVEHGLGALSLDKDGEVARARLTFERGLAEALDPAESVALVHRLAGS
ncbi:helix-turn-helix domain-containing protein [Pseudonocardia kunmingensis]|uniref:Helix-turn-helix protein n=1 Tax=Pseudonocardia kunmingensis TaxID=630975 RepID=A0A543DYR3_9PSEU|nr:helix-turn-helix transcriptional regulator [Pseudonocardia kunmingensis]TQM14379.1 helix-turn-helix protein [Pseudonocardia kunmingensis]